MLFKNPTVLYGLLFLLVPIIIHLFQLRRFKRVAFSNVAFLKPLISQTRKSRTLKKWLTLLARLLAIACLVLAFAQPYFADGKKPTQTEHLIIYLDNSYSLQAKGPDGILYQNAVNQLIEKLPADLQFSLFTNDQVYKNITRQEVANELLNSSYSPTTLSPGQIQLKAMSLIDGKNKKGTLVIISDFQRYADQPFSWEETSLKKELVRLEATESQNISIDTAGMVHNDASEAYVEVQISADFNTKSPVMLSLYNEGVLLAKTTAALSNEQGKAQFKIPENITLNGYLEIEDEGLAFDNKLFISSNQKKKIKVLNVNDSGADFLGKIYTSDEFDYQVTASNQLNYNSIKDQQVLIINEVDQIPATLAGELNKFSDAGNTLIIIPSLNGKGYNALNGVSSPKSYPTEKRIVSINFDHPLLRDVFSKRITNFQYPKVTNIAYAEPALNKVLSFEDGTAFLKQNDNTYVFAAPLNEGNSNFQNSPLVVPVFYKLGLRNTDNSSLYRLMGVNNQLNIPVKLDRDQILELALEDQRIIPEQRAFDSFVELQTGIEVSKPGTYAVLLNNDPVAALSYNIPRDENRREFYSVDELGGNVQESVSEFVKSYRERDEAPDLWKYMVAGALFFLICELMILKFIK